MVKFGDLAPAWVEIGPHLVERMPNLAAFGPDFGVDALMLLILANLGRSQIRPNSGQTWYISGQICPSSTRILWYLSFLAEFGWNRALTSGHVV